MIRRIDTPIKVEEGFLTVQRISLLVFLLLSSQCFVVGAMGSFSPEKLTAGDEEHCGFETFSRNIQIAFERSMNEYQSSNSWLISTSFCESLPQSMISTYQSLGLVNVESTPDISGIWQFDFKEEIVFPGSLDEGIQAWYPLSEWTRESRYTQMILDSLTSGILRITANPVQVVRMPISLELGILLTELAF